MRVPYPKFTGPELGPAVEFQPRRTARLCDHFNLAPTDPPSLVRPRERLECRFLRGDARRQVHGRAGTAGGIRDFIGCEQPIECPLALAVDQPLHASDVDEIDAYANDHWDRRATNSLSRELRDPLFATAM